MLFLFLKTFQVLQCFSFSRFFKCFLTYSSS